MLDLDVFMGAVWQQIQKQKTKKRGNSRGCGVVLFSLQ
jgi:hypothetical protein